MVVSLENIFLVLLFTHTSILHSVANMGSQKNACVDSATYVLKTFLALPGLEWGLGSPTELSRAFL